MTSDEFHDSVHSLISESKTLEELDAVKTCLQPENFHCNPDQP